METILYFLFLSFILLFFAYVYAVKRNDEYKATISHLETLLKEEIKKKEEQEKMFKAEQSIVMAVITDNFQILSEKERLEELLDMYIEEHLDRKDVQYIYPFKTESLERLNSEIYNVKLKK